MNSNRSLKKILLGLIVIAVPVILLSCTKNNKVKWMLYDETNCADRWTYTNNNEQLKKHVTEYLDGRGITVYEIEIFFYGTAEQCTECSCKTGRQFKIKVDKGDVAKAKTEGFFEQ